MLQIFSKIKRYVQKPHWCSRFATTTRIFWWCLCIFENHLLNFVHQLCNIHQQKWTMRVLKKNPTKKTRKNKSGTLKSFDSTMLLSNTKLQKKFSLLKSACVYCDFYQTHLFNKEYHCLIKETCYIVLAKVVGTVTSQSA